MMLPIYTFEPIVKHAIWGTEHWTVSGVNGDETGGLNALVTKHKGALVGDSVYERFGDTFPLLIKYIDAKKDLSIQVHPNDELARRKGLPCGKTEMWYIIDSKPDGHILLGLKEKITPEEYAARVSDNTITDVIQRYDVKAGDCFFVPAGRIHSIGGGTFLAEIQQTSSTTYRIYDYGRLGVDGKPRELHTQEASEAIDYTVLDDYHTYYDVRKDMGEVLVSCPYFTTARYDLTEPMTIDYSELDSFVILVGIAGSATVSTESGDYQLGAMKTLLVPASTKEITVNGNVEFLETYIV